MQTHTYARTHTHTPHLEPLCGFTVPIGHQRGGAHNDGTLGHGLASQQKVAVRDQGPQQG
jgi:hypothetical protein